MCGVAAAAPPVTITESANAGSMLRKFNSIFSLSSDKFHKLLAEVLAFEQRDKALGRVGQSIDHRLAVLELAFREIAAQPFERFAVTVFPVEHDHALHLDTIDQHRTQHLVTVG